ncbi:MAG: hypothetical protein U1C33_03715 [Candidatus Cloacimonadaceae bacterium]|nr:hypothetical protein [Candidatus Cloacimonadaceae bacterium]
MHNDLKILFWLLLFALFVLSIYTIVDLSFQALDRVSTTTYYQSVRSSYTNRPVEFDPDAKPDRNWRPRRETLPFLGYAHQSVVFIITAIILVAVVGFLVIYITNKRRES